MFIIMVLINIMLFMYQSSLNEVATQTGTVAPDLGMQSSYVDSFNTGSSGNYSLKDDYSDSLPQSDAGVLASIGAYLFPFQVLLNWLTGLPSMILAFFMTIPNLLEAMGLSSQLAFILGFGWAALAIWFLIMAVLK